MLRYDSASPWAGMDGDWSATAFYAGASAALVRDVESVTDILTRIERDWQQVSRAAISGACPPIDSDIVQNREMAHLTRFERVASTFGG
jgi:hypothetical protein